ncbi:MAG: ATP phosphoribosyltransferase [Deferribacteraceae bacterium]|jgi:ATP phosphoribosyltransferase|nr:ATP phosphoribosyltransferase [Deferribacteraceae bacterium]
MNTTCKREFVTIALPKGRLAEEAVDFFSRIGLIERDLLDFESRKLIFEDNKNALRFLLVKNTDVATYVERGGADLGVAGLDMLLESAAEVYEFSDLAFGACRMSIAAPNGKHTFYKQNIKAATKYPNITKNTFASKGIYVEIIKLFGSIEIAPLTDLADYIVDLVDTGETLRKNGLSEVEVIFNSTARLIGNKALTAIKHSQVKQILSAVGEC